MEAAMPSLADTVAEVATRLGLRNVPDRKLAYGTRDGYLVEVACGRDGNAECIVEIVRHGDHSRIAGRSDRWVERRRRRRLRSRNPHGAGREGGV